MEQLEHKEGLASAELILPVEAGHMFYDKCIVVSDNQQPVFIKAHNEMLFSNPEAALHTLGHLQREGQIYEALTAAGYQHTPEETYYDHNREILYLSAYLPNVGWGWKLPTEPGQRDHYVSDVMHALDDLEMLPAALVPQSQRGESVDELFASGWQKLTDPSVRLCALELLRIFEPDFHPHVTQGTRMLQRYIENYFPESLERAREYTLLPRTVFGHFDARQSNIAWHPEHGARLVDWSWASPTTPHADKTMFIIDLFKSGYEVDALRTEHFDPEHAFLQIGHWIARSTLPSPQGDTTVRFHQAASAVSAATLLAEA